MEKSEEINNVLVVGGGVAGIQSALDLADLGITTYLVEKEPSIGGKMAKLDKTFPTLDCSACILTPKMVEVIRHPDIKLLTYSEVSEISGTAGDFTVKIIKKPRYVKEDECSGCGLCAQHCPVEVPNEFDMGRGVRNAIYVPFPQAIPLVYTIDIENCIKCRACEKICDRGAIDFNQEPDEIELKVRSVVISTGYELFDAKKYTRYGYRRYPNVLVALELERLINASGPTLGHLLRLSDGKIPKKIAFLQCVGSRDEKMGVPYCSRICCMYAMKNAILIKEHHPDTEVTIYYTDIRAFGKGFAEFYDMAEDRFDVNFVRGKVGEILEDPETKNLIIRVENTETEEFLEEEYDMVVLSSGIVPIKPEKWINQLGVTTSEDGFFTLVAPNSESTDTNIPGIVLAGTSAGPMDIPDSVAHASAAAMRAAIAKREG